VSLEPGAVFGRDFRIVKALRHGGMGSVFVVDQLSTGKQRALKVMATELAMDPPARERFVLEARAASAIDSDHVVEIVTAGVDEETGAPFLVMELLRGEDLGEVAGRVGPLPLGDVAEVLSQLGHALEQAHAQGIVHRDLKPDNVFLCVSRRRDAAFTAKILDFGIAKLVEDSRQKTGTQPLGTPLFMSPEQTDRRGRICPATDVWALGLITFRLLTGKDFWTEADGSLAGLLREICVDPIPPASERARELSTPPLPPGFDAWFARCVSRDIDARFQGAGEAVRAFVELVPPDAPRGALTMPAGMADGATSAGASPSRLLAGAPTAPGSTAPATAALAATDAAQRAATGATMAQATPVTAKPATKAWAAVAVAGVLLGGVAVYRGLGGAPSAPPPAASAAVAATGSAGPPAPAATASACPEGMVSIAGGKMFMGARDLTPDAKPPHMVTLSRFCIDRTEVTTRAYLACTDKGECERPPDKVTWPGITGEQIKRYSPFCNVGQKERGDHPVNCVAWPMADNFCKKRGARLPTEAEWEFAARGSSQRKYPWGDDPPGPRFLNACGKECATWGDAHGDRHRTMYADDDGWVGTAPVGSFPAGASADGVLDLAGNVWEWVADWYGPYTEDAATDPKGPATGTLRAVRGGDFFGYEPEWTRPAYRWKTDPEAYNHAIGFRCVMTPR
jgi:eukaryotic-like serine/threonine-protein kinase